MRFRLGTLQILIALAAAPIWMLCEGAKAGRVAPVVLVWGALVTAPLLLMCLVERWVKNETTRDCAIVLFAAIAVTGYSAAIPVSFFVMAMPHFREIP